MKSKSSDIYLNSKLIKIERAPTLRALHSEHNYITTEMRFNCEI